MTQAAFHADEASIQEDLDYYFSAQRDKHNHIRPDEDIVSLTPTSPQLTSDLGDGQLPDGYLGNFLYPLTPGSLDRIYLGISLPLFSNSWGASFLIQLLKMLTPDGAIVLPVWPEGQAAEKGYWSRTALESVFLSRSRWKGISNISAENDGVMSLRVGRKWPQPVPSTAEWFFRERARLTLDDLLCIQPDNIPDTFRAHSAYHWRNAAASAVIERILLDKLGANRALVYCDVGGRSGALATELMLSPHINITSAASCDGQARNIQYCRQLQAYFQPKLGDRLYPVVGAPESLTFDEAYDAVSFIDSLREVTSTERQAVLQRAWKALNPGGVLIVYGDVPADAGRAVGSDGLEGVLAGFAPISRYSSHVASEIRTDVRIDHYSGYVEQILEQERRDGHNIFRVVQKTG